MLERRMAESEIYGPRLERKKSSLRVNYEKDFHLDILPACPDSAAGPTCLVIPDREDKVWQASDPKGFVKWFGQKGALRLRQMRSRIISILLLQKLRVCFPPTRRPVSNSEAIG